MQHDYCAFFAAHFVALFVAIFVGISVCTFYRSSRPELFLRKDVLKIFSKFTGAHTCRSVISTTLLCNFMETTLWYEFSPVNLLHFFWTTFSKNTSGRLLLILLKTLLYFSMKFYLRVKYSMLYIKIHQSYVN